ncbi:MAG: adenosylmethionine--8-amino-7-oxononanoate transaminase [Oligoflexales bacterium]|nr:adenosylmethionine--8-amino-7-oxononanoate transaminase [Oligoflexales bacterium]
MELLARDKSVIWHPFTQMLDPGPILAVERAKAEFLYTFDGRCIVDAISSWWVNLHGHSHPYIAEKVYAQLLKLEQVIFAGFTHAPAVELVERLLPLFGGKLAKGFFSDNGSTAVEVALKMALQYWCNTAGLTDKKFKILTLENSYHGDTFGAMSISARGVFNKPFEPYMFECESVPAPLFKQQENSLIQLQKKLAGKDKFAAFIYEPLLQGAGGMLMQDAACLNEMLKLCRKHEVLLIADEVLTGFGRTGWPFASLALEEQADLICLSKGLTGGTLPLGLTLTSQNIYDAFLGSGHDKTFFHGHSYTANPLACAAANASLDIFLSEECSLQRKKLEIRHKAQIVKWQKYVEKFDIRLCGTVLALNIPEAKSGYFSPIKTKLYEYFLQKEILMRPLGNCIYLLPPYCISDKSLDTCYEAIEAVITGSY